MAEPPIHEQQIPGIQKTIQEAIGFHQRGNLREAERLYQAVLQAQPDHFDALHFLGILRAQQGNSEAAVEFISLALERNPRSADAHSNLGNAFQELGRHNEAIASYDKALAIRPDFSDALYNRGTALQALKRRDEALASYDKALAIKPDHARALSNRGNILKELGRYDEALASYDKALAIKPDDAEALNNRGIALYKLVRYAEAFASYDKALAIKPDHAQALNNRGNILHDLRRYDEAIACYDKALAIKPDYPEAVKNRGNSLMGQKRYEQASVDFERVLRIKPDYEYIRGDLLHSKMFCCDWRMFEREVALIEADLHAGRRSSEPFGFQAVSRSPHDLLLCSKIYANDQYPASPAPIWRGEKYTNKTIRVGYVSGEFRRQATSYLIAGLFELHDKSRFTLYAFDNGFDDSSPIRRRLERSFDVFFDISGKSDVEAARLIHDNQIDILVNLNGYFGFGRTGVFALKPCPVQVNYLGFPGTIGAEYIDYIIADRHVIREDEHQHYIEKVVYLPDSYQVNDSRRQIAERTPSRSEVGLPETGFVFCCFNNTFKLTPRLFDIWMRLLREIDASVLWLYQTNAAAVRNLRREAEQRGVASERLIFAPRVMLEDHLARHRLADLFLDTLPCNAHTTASDALWSALPVVTSLGSAFPGRVAGSLLNAVGLPELITHSLEEYEALALKLATDGKLLAEIKARLAQNRATHPLFNTDRFRKHIEAAYTTMWERYQRGEPPASFAVEPAGSSRADGADCRVKISAGSGAAAARSFTRETCFGTAHMSEAVLISEEYRKMQQQLHENPNYGVASVEYAPLVAQVIEGVGAQELLDYGAGKGRLGITLRQHLQRPLTIHHYDPAILEWSAPPQPCGFVACIDVLEHIEPALLDNVLDDLKRVTAGIGIFTVHTQPAVKFLPDGRNAHLIQRPPAWWLPKFLERFDLETFKRMPQGFWVVVERRQG